MILFGLLLNFSLVAWSNPPANLISMTPIPAPTAGTTPAATAPNFQIEHFDHPAAVREGVSQIRAFRMGEISREDLTAAFPSLPTGTLGHAPRFPQFSERTDRALHSSFAAYLFQAFVEEAIRLAALTEAVSPDHHDQTLQSKVLPICSTGAIRPELATLCREMVATAKGRFRTAWRLRHPGQNPAILLTEHNIALPNPFARRDAEAIEGVVAAVKLHRYDVAIRPYLARFTVQPSSSFPDWTRGVIGTAGIGWIVDQLAAAGQTLPGGQARPCPGLGTVLTALGPIRSALRWSNGRAIIEGGRSVPGISTQCLADAATIAGGREAMETIFTQHRYLADVAGRREPFWMTVSRTALMGAGTPESRFENATNLILGNLTADRLAPAFAALREQAEEVAGPARGIIVSADGAVAANATSAYETVDAVLANGPQSPIVQGFVLHGEPLSTQWAHLARDLGAEAGQAQIRVVNLLIAASRERIAQAGQIHGLSAALFYDRVTTAERWHTIAIATDAIAAAFALRGIIGLARSAPSVSSLATLARGSAASTLGLAAAAETRVLPSIGAFELEAATVASASATRSASTLVRAGNILNFRRPIEVAFAMRNTGNIGSILRLVAPVAVPAAINTAVTLGARHFAQRDAAREYGLFLIGMGHSSSVQAINALNGESLVSTVGQAVVYGWLIGQGMSGIQWSRYLAQAQAQIPAGIRTGVAQWLTQNFSVNAANSRAWTNLMARVRINSSLQRSANYIGRALAGRVAPSGEVLEAIGHLDRLIRAGASNRYMLQDAIQQLERLLGIGGENELSRALTRLAAADAGSAVGAPALASGTAAGGRVGLPSAAPQAAAGSGPAIRPQPSAPSASPTTITARPTPQVPVPAAPAPRIGGGLSPTAVAANDNGATEPAVVAPQSVPSLRPTGTHSLRDAVARCQPGTAAAPTCYAAAVAETSSVADWLRGVGRRPINFAAGSNPVEAMVHIDTAVAKIFETAAPETAGEAVRIAEALNQYNLGFTRVGGVLARAMAEGSASAMARAIHETDEAFRRLAAQIRANCAHVVNDGREAAEPALSTASGR